MTSVFPRRVAQKVTLFLRARPTRRALTVLCLVWVALMLAPLLAMSFYAYPTHDDFPSVRLASEAWATTGSLWATLKAAWDQAMYDYQTWQGTYVAMFVCAFQPMAFSMRLFWLAPFGALTLLALSAWYLVRQITRCVLKGDLCVCAALYAALMTLLLEYVPMSGARPQGCCAPWRWAVCPIRWRWAVRWAWRLPPPGACGAVPPRASLP